jgi:type VI secretion system secreted protein VgrG
VVPHVGGPIVLGSFTVITGMMPQARQTDLMICAGPPDMIAMGCPTVQVGMAGGGGIGAIFMGMGLAGLGLVKKLVGLDYPRSEVAPDGSLITKYSPSITIKGSAQYQASVVADLDKLASTKTGQLILDNLAKTGKSVTIQPIPAGGNQNNSGCDYADPADNAPGRGQPNADGTPGKGADGVVTYNPSRSTEYTGADGKTYKRDPYEVLGHEMIHGVHQGQGNDLYKQSKPSPYDNKEEMQTIGSNDGTDDYSKDPMTEGALEKENGKSPRPDHNSITKSTYRDASGNWHQATTDAAGNTTDNVIPAPPGGGPPSQ